MEFFNSAIDVLQTLVVALGGGLCVWGGINLLEGYGQDKALHPMKKAADTKERTPARPKKKSHEIER